ncbi:MAG: hypothetical protein NTV67_02930 [Chloroflexi bacterium]|nr:hypothetical protein [Chloroflexota bacterium]
MLVPLLLAASIAAPLAVPLAAATSSTATVLANRTAFNQPCVGFTSTAPDRLAARASDALRALGWSVDQVVGPQFNQSEALQQIAPVGALYVHCQSARSMCTRMVITIGMRRRVAAHLVSALMAVPAATRQR